MDRGAWQATACRAAKSQDATKATEHAGTHMGIKVPPLTEIIF